MYFRYKVVFIEDRFSKPEQIIKVKTQFINLLVKCLKELNIVTKHFKK